LEQKTGSGVIKRLGQQKLPSKGSPFFIDVPSTIGILAASVKDPSIVVVLAVRARRMRIVLHKFRFFGDCSMRRPNRKRNTQYQTLLIVRERRDLLYARVLVASLAAFGDETFSAPPNTLGQTTKQP